MRAGPFWIYVPGDRLRAIGPPSRRPSRLSLGAAIVDFHPQFSAGPISGAAQRCAMRWWGVTTHCRRRSFTVAGVHSTVDGGQGREAQEQGRTRQHRRARDAARESPRSDRPAAPRRGEAGGRETAREVRGRDGEGRREAEGQGRRGSRRRSAEAEAGAEGECGAEAEAEGAQPRRAAPRPTTTSRKPAAVRPASPPLTARRVTDGPPPKPLAPPTGTELVTTSIRAAGELAQIGFTLGGHALKRAVDRIPRPK